MSFNLFVVRNVLSSICCLKYHKKWLSGRSNLPHSHRIARFRQAARLLLLLLLLLLMMIINDDVESYGCGDRVASAAKETNRRPPDVGGKVVASISKSPRTGPPTLSYPRLLFLPRCMECRRGPAMRILSVCASICPSHAWIVTKRKKDRSRFLYHIRQANECLTTLPLTVFAQKTL